MSAESHRLREMEAALSARRDAVLRVVRAAAELDVIARQSRELVAESRRLLDETAPLAAPAPPAP